MYHYKITYQNSKKRYILSKLEHILSKVKRDIDYNLDPIKRIFLKTYEENFEQDSFIKNIFSELESSEKYYYEALAMIQIFKFTLSVIQMHVLLITFI